MELRRTRRRRRGRRSAPRSSSPRRARDAVAARGRFMLAVSGGRTPWQMLRALAGERRAVDQRAPVPGGRARGAARRPRPQPHAHPREPARARCRCRAANMHADAGRGDRPRRGGRATTRRTLRDVRRHAAGARPRAPRPRARTATRRRWCPAIRCSTERRATSRSPQPYQGRRRMTLTYPMLNRARRVLLRRHRRGEGADARAAARAATRRFPRAA